MNKPTSERRVELILRQPRRHTVNHDVVADFQQAVLADPRVRPANMNWLVEKTAYLACGVLSKTGLDLSLCSKPPFFKSLPGGRHDWFAIMMGFHVPMCVPYFMFPGRKSLYLFDAWSASHARILQFVQSWEVDDVFVSSSQAVERLNQQIGARRFIWMPEAVSLEKYLRRPYAEKDIDVLQLGRRYDAYHNQIVAAMESYKRTYLYERQRGQVIFPAREEFLAGLARSKISICVPCSITHPDRAGDIETMTMRYLQSMASKCLVVGHAPAEMIELFGYNPVVEIDKKNPARQLLELLDNFEDYVPLIEKNYAVVASEHTWRKRWQQIARIILS